MAIHQDLYLSHPQDNPPLHILETMSERGMCIRVSQKILEYLCYLIDWEIHLPLPRPRILRPFLLPRQFLCLRDHLAAHLCQVQIVFLQDHQAPLPLTDPQELHPDRPEHIHPYHILHLYMPIPHLQQEDALTLHPLQFQGHRSFPSSPAPLHDLYRLSLLHHQDPQSPHNPQDLKEPLPLPQDHQKPHRLPQEHLRFLSQVLRVHHHKCIMRLQSD